MTDSTQLLYLEPDDEITSVVRRLRDADAGRVVLVASGRSKATTSAVALRLLAGVAAEEGREIALVADAAGRALAGEAGIPTFGSVTEANAEDAVPLEPSPARRAPIHVVRGDEVPAPRGSHDETQAVPVVTEVPRRRAAPRTAPRSTPVGAWGRRVPRAVVAPLMALLLAAGALAAVVAPAATIAIDPSVVAVGPVEYTLVLDPDGTDEGELTATVQGEATGVFRDPSPATGSVVFQNWNTVTVEVPAGTVVAAGEILFTTVETIIVPNGLLGFPIIPGEASVGMAAVEPGQSGNVGANAIDTIVSSRERERLRGFPNNTNRLVANPEAVEGGSENRQPEITREDVDAAVAAVEQDLADQLADRLSDDASRIYAASSGVRPQIDVPDGLVGRRGRPSFELTGTLDYERPWVDRETAEAAARERLLADGAIVPDGRQLLEDSIVVQLPDEAQAEGGSLGLDVTLTADAAPMLDVEQIRERVAGLTDLQAIETLRGLGDVSVELWPGWVDRIPELDWRIEVRIEDEDA